MKLKRFESQLVWYEKISLEETNKVWEAKAFVGIYHMT